MNINGNNDKGQEQVVTKGRLRTYVDWLNTTNGGSFLTASVNSNNYLVIEKMSGLGAGTIHWVATSGAYSGQETASTTSGSLSIRPSSSSTPPRGKFWFEDNNGVKYTELDNTNGGTNYSGYETMVFNESADSKDDRYCLTYADITGGTYARYFDEAEMADGLIVDSYSIASTGRYSDNQLVVEKDVNFGKFKYDLVVSAITIEVDAMNDLEEYRYGVIPGSDNLPYAVVYDVTNGTETPFKEFDLSGAELTDNSGFTLGNTYSNVNIIKGNSTAKAAKVTSGSNEVYKVDVYYYADSGYTLTSGQVITRVGTAITNKYFDVSNHTFTSANTSTTVGRRVYVTIASNGEVKFSIKQRKEIYGYFPVDVYKQGTSDYSIDENGNVALSADTKFVKANVSTSTNMFIATSYQFYDTVTVANAVSGWTDNAGDNFGTSALSNGKKYLSQNEESVYNPVLIEQGVTDMTLCGKDVYNTNNVVYDRGEEIGNSVYHVAYANDVYGGSYTTLSNSEGGFEKTRHFFCSGGTMIPNRPSYSCTYGHMSYAYDPFESDYGYDMEYERVYWKDLHSYGITSILRRFRKINGTYVDTSKSNYSEERMTQGPIICVPTSETISGNNFPKHILGKTFRLTLSKGWGTLNELKAGSNRVTGWTTIFEYVDGFERYGYNSMTYSGEPTTRYLDSYPSGGYYRVRSLEENDSHNYYNNIHPYYYMVDAESCVGKSSGYTFLTTKTITDTYGGGSSIRDYYLDDGHYFLLNGYTNIHAPKEDMIMYLNTNNGDPVFNSVRCETTSVDGCVMSSCCPSAPTQKISWIDSYAPYTGNNPSYILEKENIAFVGEKGGLEKQYMGDGAPTLNTFLVPSVMNWNNFDGNITLSDVNDFTGDNNLYHSFPGETSYERITGSSTSNISSHNLMTSVNYMVQDVENCKEYYGATDSNLGYRVDTTVYNFNENEPKNVVDSLSGFTSDGTYSADTYCYFATSDGTKFYFDDEDTADADRNQKVLPLKVNNVNYEINDNYDALRPCSGYTTIPYWYTELRFGARVIREMEEDEIFDPINEFDLELRVNRKLFTATPTAIPLSELSNVNVVSIFPISSVNFRLLSSDTQTASFSYITDGTMSRPEGMVQTFPSIKAYFDYDGDAYEISGTTYRTVKLTLLFVDVYGTFNVQVRCGVNGMQNQILSWEIDGKDKLKVGAEILARLGYHYWGDYKDNTSQTGGNSLACIGQEGDVIVKEFANKRTVTGLMYNVGIADNGLPFNEVTYDDNYATHSEETSDGEWW